MTRAHRPALLIVLVLAAGVGTPRETSAHRLAPSLLEITESADGRLDVRFKTPRRTPAGVEVRPLLPAGCDPEDPPSLEADEASVVLGYRASCDAASLVGARVGVSGLAESATNALVHVAFADGRRVRAVLHGDAPSLVVPARPGALDVLRDYFRLGVEHIATGLDHLLFVFGLLLLAQGTRALVATVTCFTLGHSVTLSVAALGWVRFPSAFIEVCIAATLLVLAVELAREPPAPGSWLRRRPWTVAFSFGLLHGFGFAGALAEIGLPDQEIPTALLSFNLGIEAGQLAFVAVALAGLALLGSALRAAPSWLARAPVTAMGALAAYWCLDRGAALF